ALPRLEVHDVFGGATEFARGLAGLVEHREVHTERRVRRLRPGDRLEDEVDRRAAAQGLHLRRHVREHADLRRDIVGGADAVEQVEQRLDGGDAVAGGVYADDRVAAAVGEAFEDAGGDAARVVGRMVRLKACRETAGQSDG